MKKNIVIINQDSGYLMVDLANVYNDSGYNVSLITGRLSQRNKPLSSEVKIIKIKRYDKSTIFHRMFSWVVAFLQIAFIVNFRCKNSHFIFVSNPPISSFINVFGKREYTLLVFDVYPDALHEIGYANINSLIYKTWNYFNRIVYSKAKRIITLSESMAKTIAQYTNKQIEVIPIWTDNTYLKPIQPQDNLFLNKYSLQGKFVVMYSGNLGETANAEIMVDFAELLKDKENIVFVIIGEGSQQKIIAQRIQDQLLVNCFLLPWQDADMLPYSLASADLALVSLSNSAGRIAIPSKLYSLLSVGVPILGLCDSDTELGSIITRNNIGKYFNFNQIQEIAEYIINLSEDKSLQNQLHQNVMITSKLYDSSNVMRFVDNHKN